MNRHRHQVLVGSSKFPNISFYAFVLAVVDDASLLGFNTIYRYAPHNDVSFNDGPHILRWSHNIITLTIVLQLHTVFSTVTCCAGL